MKLYILPLLCGVLLVGCSSPQPSASKSNGAIANSATGSASGATAPSAAPNSKGTGKIFTNDQMVGKYMPQASFSPNFPNDKKGLVNKSINATYLQLKPKNRFAFGSEKATITGVWGIRDQQIYLSATERNGVPIDKMIQQLKAQGKDTKGAEHLKDPAMFRISDDGTELLSPTPTPDVTVVLKKSP
ncbi:MAG TPA: hypothetical protein VGL56_01805 [Fimbriimonadaceae bacterium]|jgi:hypothetical protein